MNDMEEFAENCNRPRTYNEVRFAKLVERIELKRWPFVCELRVRPSRPLTVSFRMAVNERETGREILLDVEKHYESIEIASMSDDLILDDLRAFMKWAIAHEFDECLYVDGVRKWDPHKTVLQDRVA